MLSATSLLLDDEKLYEAKQDALCDLLNTCCVYLSTSIQTKYTVF